MQRQKRTQRNIARYIREVQVLVRKENQKLLQGMRNYIRTAICNMKAG